MLKKCALVATAFALALGTRAYADPFLVKTGTVRTSTGADTALDVNSLIGSNTLGNQFINTISGNGNNAFPAANNSPFRVVGANILANYGFRLGGGTGAVFNPAGAPVQPVVAVFAAEGVAPNPAQIQLTGGRVGFFSIGGTLQNNNFNEFNPITWGATNAAGTSLLSPIAVWDLKPAENVADLGPLAAGGGGPGTFNLLANQVNQAAINNVVGAVNQGFFLFKETTTFPGATLVGNTFYTTTGNAPIVPPGNVLTDEGLISFINEALRGGTLNDSFISGGTGTAGFDALNTIAGALGGLADLGGANTGFAIGYGGQGNAGGDPRSFNPSNGAGVPNTSDSFFTLGTSSSPGVQFTPVVVNDIPEPASMLLWGAGVVGFGIYAKSRRRRNS